MNWLNLIKALIALIAGLLAFLREKKLIEAGEAQATAKALKEAQDAINEAKAARARILAELDADPGKLRERDEFTRD